MPIKKIVVFLFFISSLSGCTFLYDTFVYQIDVTQGNYLEDDKLDQINLGMSQEQVIFILGSPMLIDQFDSSKWYYIRYIKPGGEAIEQDHVVFTFDNRLLTKITREGQIDTNPLIKTPKGRNAPNAATEDPSTIDDAQTDNTSPIIVN
ncbi:MAG: outer membrane protein assembly factor BamE [Psychromonas sp.]|jgi:outer membrane protein assembly factor BamE|uniref:outer membrane protein assembly factor BamE n=1 Tax=Psychromonas sp. TaxID=1884585 RepID=UPI0039E25EA5